MINNKSLDKYSDQELIDVIRLNNHQSLHVLGGVCSEILRRMNEINPLLDKPRMNEEEIIFDENLHETDKFYYCINKFQSEEKKRQIKNKFHEILIDYMIREKPEKIKRFIEYCNLYLTDDRNFFSLFRDEYDLIINEPYMVSPLAQFGTVALKIKK